jgi:predicted hotdog family 3-hydroxylacyl-ACP dehydratase
MIEVAAQACAVYVGVCDARDGGPPRHGLIMACREIEFAVESFAIGDELTIAVTKVYGQHQQAAFKATVTRGEQVCATLQLSVVDAARASAGPGADR